MSGNPFFAVTVLKMSKCILMTLVVHSFIPLIFLAYCFVTEYEFTLSDGSLSTPTLF